MGKERVKQVPSPKTLVQTSSDWWRRAISWAMGNPNPVPVQLALEC